MSTKIIAFALILALSSQLAGCASSAIIKTYKEGDSTLGCNQIKAEITQAEQAFEQAKKDSPSTAAFVIAGLLFWPALFLMDGNNEALLAAASRKENMLKLAQSKGCKTSVDSSK